MDPRHIKSEEFNHRAEAYYQACSQQDHTSIGEPTMSRRKLLGRAGAILLGATVGTALGSQLWRPGVVAAHGNHDPVPIPGGTPLLGGGFHVYGPGAIDPTNAEPSSITDFNGNLGLAFISGMVTRTNTRTGEVRNLPFLESDMRFMKGVFRGRDGQIHNGAFGFVWVDVFEPGSGPQIHDLNPTAFPPTSLFWTLEIPGDSVKVNPGAGSAVVQVSDYPVLDYGNIPNALFGGGPAPVVGKVSYTVAWNGVKERLNINNPDPVYGGFAGEFVRNSAQMEWTATVGDYHFVSAPLATSSSSFAELGHERNGIFYNK